MKNLPVKKEKHETQSFVPRLFQTPFFNFTYSSMTISSFGGKTHVKAEEKRFENGVLESREFEGSTHENIYNDMMQRMQKQIAHQMEMLFKPFSMFLPHINTGRNTGHRDD